MNGAGVNRWADPAAVLGVSSNDGGAITEWRSHAHGRDDEFTGGP